MNPKSTANLDPKLREAYERIMGTTVPQPQPAASSPTPSKIATEPNNSPQSLPQASTPATVATSTPQPNVVEPNNLQSNTPPKLEVQEVAPEPINIQTPPQMPPLPPRQEHPLTEMVPSPQMSDSQDRKDHFVPSPIPQTTSVVNLTNSSTSTLPKGKSKLMPIVLGVGGIGFFVLYGVIWAKVFGLF